MRVVIAVGGNALRATDERGRTDATLTDLALVVAAVAGEHGVVLTHGSGPQVGRRAEQAGDAVPLDVVDAEVDGYLGYLLAREIGSALPDRDVVTLLTQVRVDPDDPAFGDPTKPVGPFVTAAEATAQQQAHGWTFRAVGPATDPARFRRVVASPTPRAVLEARAVKTLLGSGTVVVAAGGGGIPVTLDAHGRRAGVEAVVDKDRTSALLATAVGADRLVLLTDVDAVYEHFGTDRARALRTLTAAEAARSALPPGSMGPKVEAAFRFVTDTGGHAVIGSVGEAGAVIAGDSGTEIRP
jgi:carbamate kinase